MLDNKKTCNLISLPPKKLKPVYSTVKLCNIYAYSFSLSIFMHNKSMFFLFVCVLRSIFKQAGLSRAIT